MMCILSFDVMSVIRDVTLLIFDMVFVMLVLMLIIFSNVQINKLFITLICFTDVGSWTQKLPL